MHQQDYYNYLLDTNPNQYNQHEDLAFHTPSSSVLCPSHSDEEDRDPNSANSGQKIGDFRKKKNWTDQILVAMTGLMHVLSPNGDILYCSESAFELTGYKPYELVGFKLMEFLHIDDMDVFIRDFQMSFHTRSQIKTCYRFRRKDDTYAIFEVLGQPNVGAPEQSPQAFFGIAQPLPTKSCVMMDTFLELKTENDWLKRRIDELSTKYGKVFLNPSDHQQHQNHQNHHHQQHDLGVINDLFIKNAVQNDSHNENLTKESWLGNQTKSIEKTLPKEGILLEEILEKKDKWKRRKNKEVDEYVCKDCGTTASPEWRKGPQGAKTLCNACGLRWAKKNKKKNSNED